MTALDMTSFIEMTTGTAALLGVPAGTCAFTWYSPTYPGLAGPSIRHFNSSAQVGLIPALAASILHRRSHPLGHLGRSRVPVERHRDIELWV